jgi:glycosyltransferase involved in cell wall biosynthesis
MNLLRSIATVNPAHGGPIEGIRQVTRVHRSQGHEVEIVSLDDPRDPWVLEAPFRVHAVGPGHGGYRFSTRLAPWVRTHAARFDAVILHGLWQYSSFGAWRGLRQSGRGYFVFPHGMLDPWFKRAYPLKHLKKWLYWPWAEYRVLRDARAVLFTCEEERRLARESFALYRCRELVVNYGTAPPDGDVVRQRAAFLDRFPAIREKTLLLFLGRIHPKKG